MKLTLEEPYASDWRLAYLQEAKSGRKYVLLVNNASDRTITSYARYLLAVSLGRYLLSTEEVDHIDEDCTNDSLDNLQILGVSENRRKNNDYKRSNRIVRHGTLSEYKYCKCDLCKAAKREYMLSYVRKPKSQLSSEAVVAPL